MAACGATLPGAKYGIKLRRKAPWAEPGNGGEPSLRSSPM